MTHVQYGNEYEMEAHNGADFLPFIISCTWQSREFAKRRLKSMTNLTPIMMNPTITYRESLITSSADRKEGRRLLPVLILYQYCE